MGTSLYMKFILYFYDLRDWFSYFNTICNEEEIKKLYEFHLTADVYLFDYCFCIVVEFNYHKDKNYLQV